MNEKVYLAALHKIWITHKKLFYIFEKQKNYKEFYEKLDYGILKKYSFIDSKIKSILEHKDKIDLTQLESKVSSLNVEILVYDDFSFPDELKNIFNIPYLIYLRWKLSFPCISFIWSRKITSYWKKIVESFLPDIWKYFSIVSWWAIWCDTYSHEIALQNSINTICVVWTWIDITYPVWNYNLYNQIIEKWWWIISIFPFWEPWNPYNFPVRNEIVAWLSKWIFIIEAKEKSWTLITAKLWLDLWKDIFCVAWDIFKPSSSWCNNLILNWEAKFVLSSKDVLNEYNISFWEKNIWKKISKPVFTDEIEKNIYDLLLFDSFNLDEIKNKLSLDISVISFKISILEIYWYIKKTNEWKYEII